MTPTPHRVSQLILVAALSACVGNPAGPRIASIELPGAPIQFDALGDTIAISATTRNGGGSVLLGDSLDYSVTDPTVVALQEATMISVGNGQTVLTVRNPESGVIQQAAVVVDQIATTLAVKVNAGILFVILPVGAIVPLACDAFDKNGFPMRQDTVIVSSVKGTVTGGACADVRVQRSGYDTLVFRVGEAQARVPVIISTRPDSVGVVAAAEPLTDVENIRYVGENLGAPSILALRPLVRDILAAYGNPSTNLDRARAIRDWVARTAIYPDWTVHPDGSSSNLSVLPPGKTWADVNATLSLAQWDRDAEYWKSMSSDGYVMLDRLIGTLDPVTGLRADDGLMTHVTGAHYRMRDLESYRYSLCTYQSVIATTLWAAAGLHGLLLQTLDHDPSAVFIPELGRWAYEDVSFSDDYLLDGTGDPLSPLDLLALSMTGSASRARVSKLPGPSYDPQIYPEGRSYMNVHPEGWVIMGSRLYRYDVPNPNAWTAQFGEVDVPELANYPQWSPNRVTAAEAFPTLGVVVEELRVDDSVFVVRLGSTYPNHQQFERRVQGGDWKPVAPIDVLPVGACRVEYRSVDTVGNISASAVLDLWVPRAEGFLQSGGPEGIRRRAQDCR